MNAQKLTQTRIKSETRLPL